MVIRHGDIMDFDFLDIALTRMGLNPDKRYGPNHGAPLSMWVGFGLTAGLALITLGVGVLAG